MKAITFSIVTGTLACNARCNFCIAKMTPNNGIELKQPSEINWRNFDIACALAEKSGVQTVLLTSKGEPTLFPDQISDYLNALDNRFPLVEIQTNGIMMAENKKFSEQYLPEWYDMGLTTIAISIVHYNQEKNRQLMAPYRNDYINIEELVKKLHSFGFSVRLTNTMCKNYIDNVDEVENLIDFARKNKVEQLTIRPVNLSEASKDENALDWVLKNGLENDMINLIRMYLNHIGKEILRLPHGAIVYDIDGQNVCLTNCLTVDKNTEEMRQLIFFPDGHIRYSWEYEGAILL